MYTIIHEKAINDPVPSLVMPAMYSVGVFLKQIQSNWDLPIRSNWRLHFV